MISMRSTHETSCLPEKPSLSAQSRVIFLSFVYHVSRYAQSMHQPFTIRESISSRLLLWHGLTPHVKRSVLDSSSRANTIWLRSSALHTVTQVLPAGAAYGTKTASASAATRLLRSMAWPEVVRWT
jgi:hypothetical protein